MPKDPPYMILEENPLGTRANWDEYFMKIAIDVSSRSSCLYVRSGSVFVNQRREIQATGYNGASGRRKENCLEIGCQKQGEYSKTLDSGDCIGIHSEMNGLGHLSKEEGDILTLYTTILPCPTCAKNLEPYNVERVIFKKPYSESQQEKSLIKFEKAGIGVARLDLTPQRYIDITFNEPETLEHGIWTNADKYNLRNLGLIKKTNN